MFKAMACNRGDYLLSDMRKIKLLYTFRLYLWEVERVREFIKSLRTKKEDG